MMDWSWLTSIALWAQGADGTGGGGAAAPTPPAGGGQPTGGGLFDLGLLPVFAIIGLLFYFMLIRPEKKKRQEMQKLLDELKENDRVVTIGGLIGTIVGFGKTKDEVILRIDEKTNTRVRVLRSAISRPLKVEDEAAGEKKELSKDA